MHFAEHLVLRNVDTAIDYISKNFIYCNLMVDDIAPYGGIDRGYLSRLFRNQLGISTQAFLIEFSFIFHALGVPPHSAIKRLHCRRR